jgi:hypothetical protein
MQQLFDIGEQCPAEGGPELYDYMRNELVANQARLCTEDFFASRGQ